MIGDRSRFDDKLNAQIEASEALTANNTGLVLTVAANYGGRWDIVNATNKWRQANPQSVEVMTEADLTPHLSMHYAPEPDLFIRTGGDTRISNFLMWQLAYTELYFTEKLWPDFDQEAFKLALQSYQGRERRFGRTSEQLQKNV
jgi:undecaprenyl diphosphate synthase